MAGLVLGGIGIEVQAAGPRHGMELPGRSPTHNTLRSESIQRQRAAAALNMARGKSASDAMEAEEETMHNAVALAATNVATVLQERQAAPAPVAKGTR